MEVETLVSFSHHIESSFQLTLFRGCVTPQVLHNWKETSNMDMELVDGYDELPEAGQEKVKLALEEVHVDDDDWNGVCRRASVM